jgi:ketosteroid isomerase-like protein
VNIMDTRAHADQWLNAWAARDLDAIMACYCDTVDFAAPTVVTRWGRPDGRLLGKQELRRHFARGLELAPDITFTEEAYLSGMNGYSLLYRRENGNRALDVVELDQDGRAARVRAFYERAQS